MHKFKLVSLVMWLLLFSGTNKHAADRVNWKTLPQAEQAFKELRKPILIDLYTEWCGWCRVMDKKTYNNKNVASYVNEKFYPVKLNAETRQAVYWSGKRFQFNTSYKTNDFAVYVLQGKLAYPATVIIPADGSAPQAIPGYLSPKEIEILLKYFGEKKFGNVSFDEYKKEFVSLW